LASHILLFTDRFGTYSQDDHEVGVVVLLLTASPAIFDGIGRSRRNTNVHDRVQAVAISRNSALNDLAILPACQITTEIQQDTHSEAGGRLRENYEPGKGGQVLDA
jgi:hypothetical protein